MLGGNMMARIMDGHKSQESATGERAAMFGGSMMARSWKGRSQESSTGERAAMFPKCSREKYEVTQK
jgi:hypothetical protein